MHDRLTTAPWTPEDVKARLPRVPIALEPTVEGGQWMADTLTDDSGHALLALTIGDVTMDAVVSWAVIAHALNTHKPLMLPQHWQEV